MARPPGPRAPPDPLDVIPRLGDDAGRLPKHRQRSQRRVDLDGAARLDAQTLCKHIPFSPQTATPTCEKSPAALQRSCVASHLWMKQSRNLVVTEQFSRLMTEI